VPNNVLVTALRSNSPRIGPGGGTVLLPHSPARRSLKLCQERDSAQVATANLSGAGHYLSRASENVRAARFLSGACQGCQIPVRKNRVRAGQGRPKPQQVEPADRNPDKKRGTPTPGPVPETCQERTNSLTRFAARDTTVSRCPVTRMLAN
jgi:hypothetical protein